MTTFQICMSRPAVGRRFFFAALGFRGTQEDSAMGTANTFKTINSYSSLTYNCCSVLNRC